MKNNTTFRWKIMLRILVFCVLFPAEMFAKLPAPELTVVIPMYGSPSGMYLKWTPVPDARDYEVCKKVGLDECERNDTWESVGGRYTAKVDEFETIPETTYTYRVRAVDDNDEPGEPSKPRRNTVSKIWPVTKLPGPSGCTADESLEVMFGYNQLYDSARGLALHQGLDLSGEKNIESECVRASMGGVYSFDRLIVIDPETGKELKNHRARLTIFLNGSLTEMNFGHLEILNEKVEPGYSVEPGTWLGNIASEMFDYPKEKPEENHVHINWQDMQNPLEAWEDPTYRDPHGNPPEVIDSNSDYLTVRFRKGPNDTTYLSDDGNVYGPVDIVVEARDAQSSYNPWQAPLKVGYYIQRVDGTDVVQSPEQPYVLIDSRNKFFGDLDGQYWTTPERAKTLFDVDSALICNAEDQTRMSRLWFTYIVTNTTGTEGIPEDLDANQCWATDIKAVPGLPPNGYQDGYKTAAINKDAKFPDGKYQVRIRLEDYVHTVSLEEADELDHKHEVIVDNFLPFVERVMVMSNVETIYDAGWEFVEDVEQLEWVDYEESKDPTPGEALYFRVQTSETMQWLSVTLPGSQSPSYLVAAPNSQGMVWEATLYPKASNESTLTFQGQGMADHPLLAFSETQPAAFPDQIPKPVPKRTASGDWPAEYEALRQDTGGDTLHQLGKFLSETFAWRITTPTESLCDYDVEHGGIICTFDEGTGFTLTTLSFQALRDVGVPEAVVDSLHSLQGQRFATEQALLEAVHAQIGQEQTAQYRSLILEHAETARGRITLYPKDFAAIDGNVQYVVFGSVGQNRTTWEGTYQVPTEGSGDLALGVAWEPQETWFPFREPDPIGQQMWCEDVPDDMPGVDTNGSTPTTRDDKGPPDATTDTATLQWAITAQPNPDPAADSCQIRVTWETEDGQAIEEAGTLLIDLQPQSLCETFQDQSEPLEATATYPWEVADRLQYFGCHIADQETEHLEDVMENGARKYWPISDHEKVLEPGECRSWYKKELMFRFFPERWPSQLPQDIPFPTSPEEGDIAIHYKCQWVEDVIANPFLLVYTTHWTWTYRCPTVYVEGEGRQTPLWGGWECDETITHITWECGDACVYLEEPGEFVLPVPVLERDLTLSP